MSDFVFPIALRWADLDPNGHMRHSVYYDLGATARIEFFMAHGLTVDFMHDHQIGPVLFREEAVFRREIHYGDALTINLLITQLRRDGSRFSFRHEIVRDDGTLCTVLHVDGAWIDTERRKLTLPPPQIVETFTNGPLAADFKWLD